MAPIRIVDVKKSYGSVDVIHGVSLEIADGEFVILVGPSGCGKSTLLRMIAGLENITGGDVILDDTIINNLPPRARDIAMVFQSYALYPHMSVAQNMAFSLKLAKRSKEEIDQKVKDAAEILDLTSLLHRKPAQLSGGQRQRVAMGRSIVRDPKVFLFDEPLSNLDAKLRVQMRAEIKSLHQRLKTTTVYVTHDQVEAMTMADRIVVMNQGIIEQIGTPMELYDYPQTLFVAGFIGSPSMNMIGGTLTREGQAVSFVTDKGTNISLQEAPGNDHSHTATMGIRPEAISISGVGTPIGEATVSVVEPTGSETLLFTQLGEDSLAVLVRERISVSPGDKLKLSVDPAQFHFFDQEKGTRLA